jgi:hypothetical protein
MYTHVIERFADVHVLQASDYNQCQGMCLPIFMNLWCVTMTSSRLESEQPKDQILASVPLLHSCHNYFRCMFQIYFGRKRPELAVALRVLDYEDDELAQEHLTMESQRRASNQVLRNEPAPVLDSCSVALSADAVVIR